MEASDRGGVVYGGGGEVTTNSAPAGVAFQALLVDEVYEFSAPRFFDFSNEETEEEVRRAELWFEAALSYAPSPFMLRIRGRSFQTESVCCDFRDMEQHQVSANENSDLEICGNSEENTSAPGAERPSYVLGDTVHSGSGEAHQQERENKKRSPTKQISETKPSIDASIPIDDGFYVVPAHTPNGETTSDVISIVHASRVAVAQASVDCTSNATGIPAERSGEVSLNNETDQKVASLTGNTSAPKGQSLSIQSIVTKQLSVPTPLDGIAATTTSTGDIANDLHAIKRQKLGGGRTRQIHNNVKNRVFLHKSKPGLTGDADSFPSSTSGHQEQTRKEKTTFISMAQMVEKFQSKTRELEVSCSRSHSHEGVASVIQRKPRLTLTRPKGPELETVHRVRATKIKSTAELEEELLVKIRKFKARPANKKILEAPSLPALRRTTPQPPEFQEFHLETMARANHYARTSSSVVSSSVHSSSHDQAKLKLTEPRSPHLETSLRARSPRVKSSQELELEELARIPKFKARPLKKRIFESKGDLGLFCNDKRQVTIPQEFHFATDERMGPRATALEHFDKLSLSEAPSECQVLQITMPNTFQIRRKERGVEKERQFSAQLLRQLEERAQISETNPYPCTADYPVVPSRPAPRDCTKPEPLLLESLRQEEDIKQRKMEEKEMMEKEDVQRREPLPLSMKERKPLTEVQESVLQVGHRASDRAECDEKIKKETLHKRVREGHETAKVEEERAIKQTRKAMAPHARFVPYGSYREVTRHSPFATEKSVREPTKPHPPSLNVTEHRRCHSGSAFHMR